MKIKKLFAGFAAAALAAGMMSMVPASAADYTALTGLTGNGTADPAFPVVEKYLVMDKDASVPYGTYTFTIAPGTAVAADNTAGSEKMPILAGPAGAKFAKTVAADNTITLDTATSATLTFSSADSTTNEGDNSLSGKTIGFDNASATDEKVSIKSLTVDFSEVTFDEPGVYRYVITEAGTISGVTNDSDTTITLDVYVVDNNGALELNSYVLHKGEDAPAKNPATTPAAPTLADKTTGFSNVYDTQNLEFGKEVTGNQGSKDKRFAVTVRTTGANAATVYQLDGNWEKEPDKKSATKYTAADMQTANNVTSLTGAQLNAGYTFYLCDGEYVKVKGLEVNSTTPVTYAITEDAEEYKSTETIAATVAKYNDINHTDPVSGSIAADKDVYTGYVNEREGVIPTGVIISIAAPAALAVIVAGCLVYLNVKRKREDSEE